MGDDGTRTQRLVTIETPSRLTSTPRTAVFNGPPPAVLQANVLLPDGYDDGARAFPVLFLLHGVGDAYDTTGPSPSNGDMREHGSRASARSSSCPRAARASTRTGSTAGKPRRPRLGALLPRRADPAGASSASAILPGPPQPRDRRPVDGRLRDRVPRRASGPTTSARRRSSRASCSTSARRSRPGCAPSAAWSTRTSSGRWTARTRPGTTRRASRRTCSRRASSPPWATARRTRATGSDAPRAVAGGGAADAELRIQNDAFAAAPR